jgi:hypothetical protein
MGVIYRRKADAKHGSNNHRRQDSKATIKLNSYSH